MIPQLQKRLKSYIKSYEKNDLKFQEGKLTEEDFYRERLTIDRRIVACYDLEHKRIKEQEFSDAQLDIWFDDKKTALN